jgi:hypothetical protein
MENYENLSVESLPNEEWRDIVGYEGYYQVSSYGRVKSFHRNEEGKLLAFRYDKDNYCVLFLHKHGKKKSQKVHRLVAEAFIPNPQSKPCVDHINTIKTDNRIENLRWCTIKENSENELSRLHLSIAKKGIKASEETKQKMSFKRRGEQNGMYGKNHSDSSKQKMSRPIVQLTCEGDFVAEFYGATIAAKETSTHRQCIVNVLKGRQKSANGFIWKYKEDYERSNN